MVPEALGDVSDRAFIVVKAEDKIEFWGLST